MFSDNVRLKAVLAAIDNINGGDPRCAQIHGTEVPYELLYGRRMSERLASFVDDASDELQIAVRGQHIRRWAIPRDTYPEGREGYREWRTALGRYHAQLVAELMHEHGYDEAQCARAGVILRKENLKRDAEVQILEDVACLVFLEYYLDDFVADHRSEKAVEVLRKTWGKMSPKGRDAALDLPLDVTTRALIEQALHKN